MPSTSHADRSGPTRCFPRVLLGLFFAFGLVAAEAGDWDERRRDMIEEIEADVRATSFEIDANALDERVMRVMGRVPRHEFVPAYERRYAYQNRPLPIGHGQTISQPYIVALMSHLASISPGEKALEIGTGSGYQAAILAELGARVHSIEIIPELATEANQRLGRLGYDGIRTRTGDGYFGWEESAPFDAIVVTAAAGHVPPPLLRQLAPEGRMVIPVGGRFAVQQLLLVTKTAKGEIQTRQVLPVRFVPLTGDH